VARPNTGYATVSRGLSSRPKAWLMGLALVSLAIVSIPLVYLGVRAGAIPFAQIVEILSRPQVATLALNTIALALSVR
jgi:ABC-type Fe3+ transport system permease subunit